MRFLFAGFNLGYEVTYIPVDVSNPGTAIEVYVEEVNESSAVSKLRMILKIPFKDVFSGWIIRPSLPNNNNVLGHVFQESVGVQITPGERQQFSTRASYSGSLQIPNSEPRKADSKRVFPCEACGKIFSWPQSRANHCKYQCGKEPGLKCPDCDFKTKLKGSLIRHMRARHPVNLNIT